ncbi:hypothetical protein [Providencia stuartii]|uniref:hypothetical protein n=1 Tax=Providencia stuartii TaxID=588 RepID=UPI001D12368E|nr:hypothetical protein [Providencia stuartii]
MKKPISLWIIQIIIIINISSFLFYLLKNTSFLFVVYKMNIPLYLKIETYFFNAIMLLVLVIQVAALYLSFKRNRLARIFTLLGWFCFLISFLYSNFSGGWASIPEGPIRYDSDLERLGALWGKYEETALCLLLTAFCVFQKNETVFSI